MYPYPYDKNLNSTNNIVQNSSLVLLILTNILSKSSIRICNRICCVDIDFKVRSHHYCEMICDAFCTKNIHFFCAMIEPHPMKINRPSVRISKGNMLRYSKQLSHPI